MTLSPEELQRRLNDGAASLAVQAHLDQQQAALDDNRDIGTWWAALMALADVRGNASAKAMALHNLRLFLGSRREDELLALSSYLLVDVVYRHAVQGFDSDIPAAVADMVEGQMIFFEKFVASDGASCPACGADKGWGDHDCDDGVDDVEE